MTRARCAAACLWTGELRFRGAESRERAVQRARVQQSGSSLKYGSYVLLGWIAFESCVPVGGGTENDGGRQARRDKILTRQPPPTMSSDEDDEPSMGLGR